jgi:hypothetical protein
MTKRDIYILGNVQFCYNKCKIVQSLVHKRGNELVE